MFFFKIFDKYVYSKKNIDIGDDKIFFVYRLWLILVNIRSFFYNK